jgi:hypothetical protein
VTIPGVKNPEPPKYPPLYHNLRSHCLTLLLQPRQFLLDHYEPILVSKVRNFDLDDWLLGLLERNLATVVGTELLSVINDLKELWTTCTLALVIELIPFPDALYLPLKRWSLSKSSPLQAFPSRHVSRFPYSLVTTE